MSKLQRVTNLLKVKMKRLKFKNLTIGWKFGLSLLIIFMLFAASTVIVSVSLNTVGEKIDALERRADRSVAITEMGSIIRGKSNNIVNYIQDQDSNLIEEYEALRDEFNTIEGQLKTNMDTKEKEDLFREISLNDKRINNIFSLNVIPALKNGDVDYASEFIEDVDEELTKTLELLDSLRGIINEERTLAVTEADQSQATAFTTLLISVIVSILVGGITTYFISRAITRNLNKVVVMSNRIADGDLAAQQIDYNGQDEIGVLAAAMNRMNENLKNVIQQVSNAAAIVNSNSEELMQSTNEINEGGVQMASTMQELSSGAESQANNATVLNEMMEEFNEKVTTVNNAGIEVGKTSNHVLKMSEEGRTLMDQSVQQMGNIHQKVTIAVDNVKSLNEESQRISKLSQMIQEIAQQTNLLSLNASIEAARAGEHGKGFAVVASEVRKLSDQVAESGVEITKTIQRILKNSDEAVISLESSYHEVENGTNQIEVTGRTFETINNSVSEMNGKIQNISSSLGNLLDNSKKMSESIEEVAAVAEESAAGIEQAAAATEQTSSSMHEISGRAQELATLSEKLNEQVSKFTF
nr:HAMP domain-containing methyl-accepting chemotaxis protein [Paenibacillus bovis]